MKLISNYILNFLLHTVSIITNNIENIIQCQTNQIGGDFKLDIYNVLI